MTLRTASGYLKPLSTLNLRLVFFFLSLDFGGGLRTPDLGFMVVRVGDVLPGGIPASTGLNVTPTHSAPLFLF